jgi:hypothetical protein
MVSSIHIAQEMFGEVGPGPSISAFLFGLSGGWKGGVSDVEYMVGNMCLIDTSVVA